MGMPPFILIAILFAAFLHALWNIIVKSGENKLFETGLNAFGACAGQRRQSSVCHQYDEKKQRKHGSGQHGNQPC